MTDVPEFIHHYTSQDAFLGIVKTKKFWATDIRYLNDSAEFTYAVQLACEVCKEYEGDERYTIVKSVCEVLSKNPYGYRNASLYVASFSEECDLLSQWRAYCPVGSGFSIAFHRKTLEQIGANSQFRLIPCEYDENKQKQLMHQVFQETSQQPDHSAILHFFTDQFFKIAPSLKHPTFAEEREWRLVSPLICLEDPQVKYRSGKSMLIPYVEFQIIGDKERLIIDHVRLAPTPHPELAEDSAYRYLRTLFNTENLATMRDLATGFTHRSKIPFRAW